MCLQVAAQSLWRATGLLPADIFRGEPVAECLRAACTERRMGTSRRCIFSLMPGGNCSECFLRTIFFFLREACTSRMSVCMCMYVPTCADGSGTCEVRGWAVC